METDPGFYSIMHPIESGPPLRRQRGSLTNLFTKEKVQIYQRLKTEAQR